MHAGPGYHKSTLVTILCTELNSLHRVSCAPLRPSRGTQVYEPNDKNMKFQDLGHLNP